MTDRFCRLLFLITIPVIAFASIRSDRPDSLYKIKVRIAKNLDTVEISGTDLTRKLHPINEEKQFGGRKKIKFNCQRFTKDNKQLDESVLLASLKSSTGLVTFKKKKYQGKLHVVTSNKSRRCDVVNELNMDDYISSLLSKEMNASWPIEALKAQAIAARTYALNKMMKTGNLDHDFYDLENSEKHQVNGDFFDVTKRTMKAALETSGRVLVNKKGELVPAFFHASCGGHTLKPHEVWANKVVGYKSTNCNYCKKKKNWESDISKTRFKKFLKWGMKKKYFKTVKLSENIRVYPDKKSKKYVNVKIAKKRIRIKKSLFRRYFGRRVFPSNNFYVADHSEKGDLLLVGKGNGHGVGLCQVGSKGLAQKGWDYKRILSHYFPELKLERVY